MNKLRVLDLFSGIGGFSLGLERTGGFETVAFCEIEAFPRKVLAKHWPDVPCYEDVRTLTAERLAADGIAQVDCSTGGFPCQDISTSGRQAGIVEGSRSGLWSEIVRLAGELRPGFIIVENVANLLSGPSERPGAWFGRVLGDLAELGYNAQWENIPAAAVGAPIMRRRVWLVAFTEQVGRLAWPVFDSFNVQERRRAWAPAATERTFEPSWHPPFSIPESVCVDDGVPTDVDGPIGAYGNSVVPQIPELIGNAILQAIASEREAA